MCAHPTFDTFLRACILTYLVSSLSLTFALEFDAGSPFEGDTIEMKLLWWLCWHEPRALVIRYYHGQNLHKGAFNNYVDWREWVGGQSNVYAYKVNDLSLFTSFVYEGWVGGPKGPKICLRSY